MAKNVKDIYGVLNGKGKREITLQKICDIIVLHLKSFHKIHPESIVSKSKKRGILVSLFLPLKPDPKKGNTKKARIQFHKSSH